MCWQALPRWPSMPPAKSPTPRSAHCGNSGARRHLAAPYSHTADVEKRWRPSRLRKVSCDSRKSANPTPPLSQVAPNVAPKLFCWLRTTRGGFAVRRAASGRVGVVSCVRGGPVPGSGALLCSVGRNSVIFEASLRAGQGALSLSVLSVSVLANPRKSGVFGVGHWCDLQRHQKPRVLPLAFPQPMRWVPPFFR